MYHCSFGSVRGPHELENEIFGIVDSHGIDCACLGWTIGGRNAIPADPPAGAAKREPHSPGYVHATDLPDGTVPPPNQDGDFIIGPTHSPAQEMTAQDLTHGSVVEFTMSSAIASTTRVLRAKRYIRYDCPE